MTETQIARGPDEFRPYLDRVASTDPVPGGGSVAAIMAALSAALAEMVGALTASKPRYDDVREQMEEIARRATGLSARCLDLADADSNAFAAFMEAMRLPKESAAEQALRGEAMSLAAEQAAMVPLEVCRSATEVLSLLETAHEKALPAVATDVASAAAAAEAALKSASLNVLVNLPSISSKARRAELKSECTEALEKGRSRAMAIDSAVRAELLD